MTIPGNMHVYKVNPAEFYYFATDKDLGCEENEKAAKMKEAANALKGKFEKFSQAVKRTNEIIGLPAEVIKVSQGMSRLYEKVLDIFFAACPMNLRLDEPDKYKSQDRMDHIGSVIRSHITYQTFKDGPSTIQKSLEACTEIKKSIAAYCTVDVEIEPMRNHLNGDANDRLQMAMATRNPLVGLAHDIMLSSDLSVSALWNEHRTAKLKIPPNMAASDFQELKTIYRETLLDCEMELNSLLRSNIQEDPDIQGSFLGITV